MDVKVITEFYDASNLRPLHVGDVLNLTVEYATDLVSQGLVEIILKGDKNSSDSNLINNADDKDKDDDSENDNADDSKDKDNDLENGSVDDKNKDDDLEDKTMKNKKKK